MPEGKARHFFPGGNTYQGFFSYYNHILGQEEAKRIVVIKGGPGVGKSTFMKKLGNRMLTVGYDVEFMHCSSDNNSLDGVVIPSLGYAFIDGTAPHVVDPKSPGAVDEILNFGSFWNEEGIRAHKAEIIKETREIGCLFARAYRFLRAAYSVYEDCRAIYGRALLSGKFNRLCEELLTEVFYDWDTAEKEGKQRYLFASAITPNGLSNFLDTILSVRRIYEIRGGMGTGEEKLLERIMRAAVRHGLNVEAFYCALDPAKIEHLVIPSLNIAFTTSNGYHSSTLEKYDVIDMMDYMDSAIIEGHEDDLLKDRGEFEALISEAISTVKRAKSLHDHLETYYVPNINFEKVQQCYDEVLQKMLQ